MSWGGTPWTEQEMGLGSLSNVCPKLRMGRYKWACHLSAIPNLSLLVLNQGLETSLVAMTCWAGVGRCL